MLTSRSGILVEAASNSGPVIMKISTAYDENLDRSSWKSGPLIKKFSIYYHENLDRKSWK